MALSKTTSAAYGLILVQVLKAFGVELSNELADAVVTGIVSIGLLVVIILERFKRGDITAFGQRK